jgi:hypothetical protein
LINHLRRVIKHVGKTHGKFRELSVDGLKTMPIPYFGDIEKAEILTVGVNPAASEFKNRNWPEIEATADYLAPRLRNYFCLRYPVAHRWFSPWEESLRMLNGRSYRNGAAHLDLSPQATATIPRDVRPREMFLEMVESDLPIFFETISLCRAAKVLLMAGSVTNKFYINPIGRAGAAGSGPRHVFPETGLPDHFTTNTNGHIDLKPGTTRID